MLSTLPFAALLSVLAVMTVAIMIAAWPGRERAVRSRPATHEIGTAPRGWLQEARREMR